MRVFFTIFTVTLLFSCSGTDSATNESEKNTVESEQNIDKSQEITVNDSKETNKQKSNDKQQDKYYNLLFEKVPEIEAKQKEIAKLSNGDVKLKTTIDFELIDGKYYLARIFEDHQDNIVTLWRFYIDSKTDEILYYNVIEDNLISLKEWRKSL